MAIEMGLGKLQNAVFKRKFRWLFFVEGINNQQIIGDGVNALPPSKASRPSLSFKSTSFEHLNETIFFPIKPDWKPINLVLFDTKCNMNPIWDNWITPMYNPKNNGLNYNYPIDEKNFSNSFKKNATLKLYDGCGEIMESWVFENAYPEDINFDELSMEENGIVSITLTLRYDRAYVESYSK